jgi:MSHA biogenesis protein MshL
MKSIHLATTAAAALLLAGCASAGHGPMPVRTSVRLDSVAMQSARQPAPAAAQPSSALPQLPASAAIVVDAPARRIVRLDAVEQDLRVVLRALATNFGLGFQIDPGVSGVVTASLQGVTLDDALAQILPKGYTYVLQEGTLRVSPARIETQIFSLAYVALSRVGTATTVIQRRLSGSQNGGGQQQSGFGSNTAGNNGFGGDVISAVAVADLWEEIRIALEGLIFDGPRGEKDGASSAGGAGAVGGGVGAGQRTGGAYSRTTGDGTKLIINPIAGTILVSALPSKLTQVSQFITLFESSVQRQVLIEAKIVEVSLDRGLSYGIDWNLVSSKGNLGVSARSDNAASTSGNVSLTLNGGSTQITAILNALSTQGDVQVLSSPRVSALNNQRATFNVTTDEVFFAVTRQPILGPTGGTIGFNTSIQPQQISVGIVLDVLAQVGADNTITMNIRPEVTSVSRVESITLDDGSTARAPVIERRETDTMARRRAGETLVIGGLVQTRHERTTGGVPILRDIPLLGKLFTKVDEREHRSELVIFLTPTIIAGQPQPGR